MVVSLGRREFSVTEDRFQAYIDDIAVEARRARRLYDLLVIPGAEITQNHIRSSKNLHIVPLNIKEYIGADQSAGLAFGRDAEGALDPAGERVLYEVLIACRRPCPGVGDAAIQLVLEAPILQIRLFRRTP